MFELSMGAWQWEHLRFGTDAFFVVAVLDL
jgi:hypothetical protein